MNIKFRNLFRHQINNDQMPRIRITDQKPSRQLDMLAFIMLHVLVFIMLVGMLILMGVFVVFIFAVTVNVNERDWVYVFRNLEHRIVVRCRIMDQFLQP